MHKIDAFVAKIVNTRLTKIFMAFDERLPTSATLKDRLSTSLKCLGFHCFHHQFWTQYFEGVICFFIFLLFVFAVSGLLEYCFFPLSSSSSLHHRRDISTFLDNLVV